MGEAIIYYGQIVFYLCVMIVALILGLYGLAIVFLGAE
jgi:hypothetical protein